MLEPISSQKPTILYVGHKFHVKTKSTQFLLDLLEDDYRVDFLLVDDATNLSEIKIPRNEFCFTLIFQVDVLAAAFLAAGHRVILAPMYDGSGTLPDIHWRVINKCLFLNFSYQMHLRISRIGGKSLLLKYFPKPTADYTVRDFATKRLFFWRRRPDHNIDLPLVERFFGDQLDSIHIHDAPDVKTDTWRPVRRRHWSHLAKKITVSTWFDNPADLQNTVEKANIYLAPRVAEGIGMGFLEAMSRGMAVIAFNRPTHNEYISNWTNGILFDHGNGHVDLSRESLIALGIEARRTVELGYDEWLRQRNTIKDFCETAVAEYSCDEATVESVLRITWESYKAGIESYGKTLSSSRLIRTIFLQRQRRKSLPDEKGISFLDQGTLSPLDEPAIVFGQGRARPFLKSGWSHDEESFVWMCATRAVLEFSCVGELEQIRVDSWRPELNGKVPAVGVVVNNAFVGSLSEEGVISLDHLPREIRACGNYSIEFIAEYGARIGSDPRTLVMAVKSIEPIFA